MDEGGTTGGVKGEIEHRWRDLGEFIREQRRVGHLSLRKLSEKAGISNPYLSQIERGLRKPSAEILKELARALEISAETLYVRAGILDEPSESDLPSEIRRDPKLTEEQKKTLLRIYLSFLNENGAVAAPGDEGSDGGDVGAGDGEDRGSESSDAASG